MLTVSAFDADVWIRDIDSSPSPFPIPIILGFLHPHPLGWCNRKRHDYDNTYQAAQPAHSICSLACNCPLKPRQSPEPGPRSQGEERRSKIELVQALVRLPNAAEQRTSIAVSFELLGRFNERGNFMPQVTSWQLCPTSICPTERKVSPSALFDTHNICKFPTLSVC